MSPRAFAGIVGFLIALAGLIALAQPPTATYDSGMFGRQEVECGTVFSPGNGYSGAPAAACEGAIGVRRAWGWPLLAVGVLAGLGAMVIQTPGRRSTLVPRTE